MTEYIGTALSWRCVEQTIEVELHAAPLNEIGTRMLTELERLVAALPELEEVASSLILSSRLDAGFCAGADLRELYTGLQERPAGERQAGVRAFLERIHAVLNTLDASPLTTIAAVHGVVFGGGFELALTCDLIIADRMARFCFPELRLGLIPGFGGIPRLNRDLGNSVVRDLLLTGRSINASKAATLGLVSQLVGEGQARAAAQATARQVGKFDPVTRATAKAFLKPIPHEALAQEIDTFVQLLARPAVEQALHRFVTSDDPYPYLP